MVNLSALVFGVDETIQYSFEVNAPGVAVTGRNSTFRTGTQSSIATRVDLPSALLTQHTVSSNLVGDGVLSRSFAETMERGVTGDGTVARALAVDESKTLTGDGLVSRTLAVTVARDMTGDGTVTESRAVVASKSFDLTGDGVLTSGRAAEVFKTFDLTGDGVVDAAPATGYARTFDLTGDGVITGSADIPFPNIPEGDCPADWSPNDGAKSISGTVFFHEPPNQGDPVEGATVCLFRDSDGFKVGCTTTAADGSYSFPRDTNDPYTYHVEVNWTDGGTSQQGLSENGCVPS